MLEEILVQLFALSIFINIVFAAIIIILIIVITIYLYKKDHISIKAD